MRIENYEFEYVCDGLFATTKNEPLKVCDAAVHKRPVLRADRAGLLLSQNGNDIRSANFGRRLVARPGRRPAIEEPDPLQRLGRFDPHEPRSQEGGRFEAARPFHNDPGSTRNPVWCPALATC